MPKFCANLGFLFLELPFMERIAAAAEAGFRAVEFSRPPTTTTDARSPIVSPTTGWSRS